MEEEGFKQMLNQETKQSEFGVENIWKLSQREIERYITRAAVVEELAKHGIVIYGEKKIYYVEDVNKAFPWSTCKLNAKNYHDAVLEAVYERR